MSMNDSSAASALVYANRRAQLRTLIDHRSAGNIAAFADQFGYSRSRVSQFLSDTYNEGRSIGERAARALEEAAVLPFGWLDTRHSLADSTTDHSAKLRSAIVQTRLVFEGEPIAVDVLAYLESVLVAGAAGAPVHAQTGVTPGAENASIAKETHTPLGAALTPVAGSEWPAWARDLDKVATDMKQIEVATGNLFSELANILGTVGATTFDQAAAAMAAESAEMVADAERSVAARAGAIICKLVVEVDTTQLDAALAKAEQLKVALAGLAPRGVLS